MVRQIIKYEHVLDFFEIGCDKVLFDGLKITRETELCNTYMGKFPVILITLQRINTSQFWSLKFQA